MRISAAMASMRGKVSVCVMWVVLIMYRQKLHRATTGLMGGITSKQQRAVSIEDEVVAEHLLQDLVPSTRVPCGKEKCFYRSKSGDDDGYLIARCSRDFTSTSRFERLVAGWQLSQQLTQDYHIKHFLEAPPENITVSKDLASFLNQNLWFESHDEQIQVRGSRNKRFPVGSYAYIQKVKVAPQPNLLLAVAPSNQVHFDRHVEEFLLNTTRSFARRFRKNLRKTRELLRKEPCLIKDFQVLMDQRGELYHLDFDRCFQPRENDETEECFQYLDEIEERIQQILEEIKAGNITLASLQASNVTFEEMNEYDNITFATEEMRRSGSSEDDEVNENVNVTKKSPQLESFQPDNLLESERVPCGKEKCFFQTKSDPEVAYLVARSSEKENRKKKFKTLKYGWKLAEKLRRKQKIEHFLLAPPANVTISKALASRLNQNLWSERLQKMFKSNDERFPEGSTAFVQKVKTAPEPNIIIGCSAGKQIAFKKEWATFLASIENKESFARQFYESFTTQTRELLQVEPCLLKDFQVLVDTKGNVYQLDFDRCFSPESGEKKYTEPNDLIEAPCIKALDDIERQIFLAVITGTGVE